MRKLLFAILFILFSFAKDINREFANKYLSNIKQYEEDINNSKLNEKLQNSTSSFNLKTELDENESKKQTKDISFVKSNSAKEQAKEVNNQVRSEEFEENVKGMKEYILSDKGFNYNSYLGKYQNLVDEVIKGKVSNLPKNNFLSNKQKIYVVISSSIPKETIQNYFKTIQPVRTDVIFVTRGFIGDIKYIKPTLKWMKDILTKPNCNEEDKKKCMYQVNLEINPKVTRHFNISEVPAVIFVRNYDGFLSEYMPLPKESKEEAYIAYGDANIIYALEKINKKAKDKHLSKLIKEMRGGFFR